MQLAQTPRKTRWKDIIGYTLGEGATSLTMNGISGFAMGHEGDQLKWIDAASGSVTTGWSWGCSHSMSELIRYEPGSAKFLTACVTDCYPGTTGTTASKPASVTRNVVPLPCPT